MGVLRARVGGSWVDINTGTSSPAGGTYTHIQGSPATVWTIAHGLGYPPNVTVIDSAGEQVEGEVDYVADTVVVTFSAAFSGKAYLS